MKLLFRHSVCSLLRQKHFNQQAVISHILLFRHYLGRSLRHEEPEAKSNMEEQEKTHHGVVGKSSCGLNKHMAAC